LSPLRPKAGTARETGYHHHDLFKNLLRNCSCDIDEVGSSAVRQETWTYLPPDPCPDGAGAGTAFSYKAGFLPAGNDLSLGETGPLTEAQAQELCLASKACAGFTFQAQRGGPNSKYNMIFKSESDDVTPASGWHTFKRRSNGECVVPKPIPYVVDVLRESPPVFIVNDFITPADCEHMTGHTIPKMGRSVVGGGGTSSWRQSYSVNMAPDFDDPFSPVTALARRKFAFARQFAGYSTVEGDGQEPINAVYYKDNGDQYRPHCDGECNGGRYSFGSRIATSLVYCDVADQGGHTLFTRSGLKIVPKSRQMLFFGYFFNGSTAVGDKMDDGHTEHSGCPLRKGHKWIATMWFREGVTAEKDWQYYSRKSRGGV